MNIEEFRDYCLNKIKVTEEFPFGPDTLVFKVAGKVFALTGLDSPELKVNLKCSPEHAIELRDLHPEIKPGYHMNKKHWNTVSFEGNLDETMLKHLVDHSYDLVVKTLPKSKRKEIGLI